MGSLLKESPSSLVGSLICPSDTHCTHVQGLQVAVVVGLGGDLFGRQVWGDVVPGSVRSVSIRAWETVGTFICDASVVVYYR